MRGQFVNGHIEVDGEPYPDGTVVEFVVRDENGDLDELTPEQEAAIEESIAEIERGDCITGEEMLAQLRATLISSFMRRISARWSPVEHPPLSSALARQPPPAPPMS